MKIYVDDVDDTIINLYMKKYNLSVDEFCLKCHLSKTDYIKTLAGDGSVCDKVLYVISYFTNIPYFAMNKNFIKYFDINDVIKNCK